MAQIIQCIKRTPLELLSSAFLWLVLLIFSTWVVLHISALFIEPLHGSQEPPLIKSKIPLLGHLWGVYRHGPKYFQITSRKTSSPIYTLKIWSRNVYVITSPNLVNTVSRNSKSISFNPFIAEAGIRMTQASREARAIIERNIDGSEGTDSYVLEIHDRTIAALAPGPEMQRMSLIVLQEAWNQFLQPLEASGDSQVSLYALLRHMITINSTKAYYGPFSPLLRDKTLGEAFWDYNASLNMLLLDVHPELIAPRGHRARTRIASAFKEFFDSNPVGRSSYLAEGRYLIGKKHGMSNMDMGRLEVGTMIGILVNTIPTLFYLLLNIFKSPTLLAALRDEIEQNAITVHSNGKAVLNMSSVRNRCPLFYSTLQETLRNYSEAATVRLVCEDTMLEGRYLLKKGSILQMPNSVIHRDKSVWGNTSFQAGRFLKKDCKFLQKDSSTTTSAGSYRPFGGGSTLCPARHFATSEIMGLASMFMWRFEMKPAEGRTWVLPKPKQYNVIEAVFPPSHDLDVVIERRGLEQPLSSEWSITFDS